MNLKVDFFAYSFKNLSVRGSKSDIRTILVQMLDDLLPDKVYSYLIDNDCEYFVAENPGMGYRFRMTYPNVGISIMSDGATDGHGTHVVLSGSCISLCNLSHSDFLDFYESMEVRCDNLSYFLCDLQGEASSDIEFMCSRVDFCYDFSLPFSDFYCKYQEGLFEFPAKKSNLDINSDNNGTIYIGSRSCASFIRIYDKALQLKETNYKLLGVYPDDVPDNFTRVEFEFKNLSKYRLAELSFKFYLYDSQSLYDLCFKYLKINEKKASGVDSEGNVIYSVVPWHIYQSVILSNSDSDEFTIDYNKSYQTSINITYLQICANLIVTYCKRIPGLLSFLKENYTPSKSALHKSANINMDFQAIYSCALDIVNEQELIILDYLSDLDKNSSE